MGLMMSRRRAAAEAELKNKVAAEVAPKVVELAPVPVVVEEPELQKPAAKPQGKKKGE